MKCGNVVSHSRPWIVAADRKAVEAVLRTGMLAQAELVDRFEKGIAKYVGSHHAIAQSSGTAALILALKTLKIGVGDSVVLPTYVCQSVLEAILSVGATPKFCDVNNKGVIEPALLEPVVDRSTKAIIAVHIFGHPCPILPLRAHQLPIIEDACQSFGLMLGASRAGSLGDIGIFSFHATKCLTTGEGGMLVTDNHDYAARALQMAQGSEIPSERISCPMSDLQAALGLSQLVRYADFEARRKDLLTLFMDAAQRHGLETGTPKECNLPFRFTFRVDQSFTEVKDRCDALGVNIRRGVDRLLHRTMGLSDTRFPNSVRLFDTTVSIPFYPGLSDAEVKRVIAAVGAIARHK